MSLTAMLSSLSPSSGSSLMASNSPHSAQRPNPLRPVRSFRVERSSSPDAKTRTKRASTLDTASKAQAKESNDGDAADTFVSRISEESIEPPRASVDLDDLPIELISLTDRFIDSLSAKVHPTPPNIDNLSRMFQEFYATASSHIQTHVDTLATLQRREDAPPLSTRPSAASVLRSKAASLSSKEKARATPPRRESDQQLLTPEEYANRKKARRALEVKKSLLEEAVERRLCEGIYSKIYRHRTTSDEASDAKLRSKTAALAVVGIGPADLGVELGTTDNDPRAAARKQEEVREWLEEARKELVLMSQSRYPLGKLNHLKTAHKSIIDTLSHFHPSSSADELMPMLIYTLITLPPENLNVISDVNFIQRFRWEPKLIGEAAYCLTTLEATIAFLETVDLSTLRADETPTGPLNKALGASPAALKGDDQTFPPAFSPTSPSPTTLLTPNTAVPPSSSTTPTTATASLNAALQPTQPSQQQQTSGGGLRATVNAQLRNPRRLSDLLVRNTPTPTNTTAPTTSSSPFVPQALGAASDAVLNTADQGLKTIGNSLGDSYKFLMGKLRERADVLIPREGGDADSDGGGSGIGGLVGGVLPKTLDEARRLVATPPPMGVGAGDEGEGVVGLGVGLGSSRRRSPSPGVALTPDGSSRPPLLGFIAGSGSGGGGGGGGRKVSRDHSADSARSAASSSTAASGSRRGAELDRRQQHQQQQGNEVGVGSGTTTVVATGASPVVTSPPIIDSMRNLGNSLNPMARLSAGIGGFRGFGRSSAQAQAPTPPAKDGSAGRAAQAVDGGDLATAFPDLAAVLPPREQPKISPPIKRFLEMQNAADMKLGDVFDLLRDYKRLAAALKESGAFKE